jgi:TRAP-type C4-dicarboxylate transport system permease small subunit
VNNPRRTWIGLGIIAIAALLIVLAPSGGSVVNLVNNTLNAIFLTLIAFGMVRLYRTQGEWLSSLSERNRGIVYGAIAAATLTLVAADRFRALWNGGIVLVILVVGACGFAIYWVWRDSRRWVI